MVIYEPEIDAKTLIMQSVKREDLENVRIIFNFGLSSVKIKLTPETFKWMLVGDKML